MFFDIVFFDIVFFEIVFLKLYFATKIYSSVIGTIEGREKKRIADLCEVCIEIDF